MHTISYNLLTIQNPSMLFLSMLVDRWRIRYTVGWSFHGVTKKVYKKKDVVTQHTTACCSIQVVDITLVKYQFTNITSLRVVQQKHSGLYSSTEYYKP
jgi:hypothetical protein